MISFLRHTMLKRLLSCIKRNWIPLLFFLVLFVNGACIGLSDDEAYYWVLAQKPAFGYAFHPPAVAWFISFFQWLAGGLLGNHNPALVRLPAVLSITVVLAMSLRWLERVGLSRVFEGRASLVLLSFAGFFSLSWMMVPDIPLFLGWMILFSSSWNICFEKKLKNLDFIYLTAGTTLTLLSKYSGILTVFSSFLAVLIWCRRSKDRWKAVFALMFGGIFAAIPILIWNYQHEWGSILYQIRDRHGGAHISWTRYARFWVAEMFLAGPILIIYTFWLLKSALKASSPRWVYFVSLYIAPAAAVFCFQPLLSDFKLHWSFVVWWPAVLALASQVQGKNWRWVQYQAKYGVILGFVVLISCQVPLISWGVQHLAGQFDPRLDVTNDLYGWSDLSSWVQTQLGPDDRNLPIVGSHYQTAAQAAFSLGDMNRVTLLPRDLKERDEWPNLTIAEGSGPQWPKLKSPVLFVKDIRYDSSPEFPSSNCRPLARFEKKRRQFLAKWIELWRCDPSRS